MNASAAERKLDRSRQQRDRILQAAQQCFIKDGFHAASMANIADTAGMSAGLIYRYFASKSDIILAIIGEELGLFGMLVVLGLFVAFGLLGARIAMETDDCFGRLLAVGITTWICVQAFVNIGAAVGVLPITGVPLPFVSFGGSSLLASMAACGILLNVARRSSRPFRA